MATEDCDWQRHSQQNKTLLKQTVATDILVAAGRQEGATSFEVGIASAAGFPLAAVIIPACS